jgi:hypothetical protein
MFRERMMNRAKSLLAFFVCALVLVSSQALAGGKISTKDSIEIDQLISKIGKLEKTEVVLKGKVLGACKSGCKMWLGADDYKDGDLYALIRAKDDAFKFDTKSTGKTIYVKGYAIAKYMDYCGESGTEKEGVMDECETPIGKDSKAAGKSLNPLAKKAKKDVTALSNDVKDAAKEVKLDAITFFATEVEYK